MSRNRIIAGFLLLTMLATGCQDDEFVPESLLPGKDIYVPDPSFKIVGYFPYYQFSLLDQIEFDKLTCVNIAFGNLTSDGELVVGDQIDIGPVVASIRSRAPEVRVMLSLAGGFIPPDVYQAWLHYLVDDERQQTILKMLDVVARHGLDGLDVDIEGQLIDDLGPNYNRFVIELRQWLHAEGKAMTAALPGTWVSGAIEPSTLEAYDYVNLMVYDATGSWNPGNPGPHSPYSMAEQSIEFWTVDLGIDPSKLTLGMPFYGRDFDPTHEHGWMYRDIIGLDVNYAYQDEVDLLYYNGIPTIVEKTKLAMHELNGVMFWELAQDTFDDLSLLRAVDQVLSVPCPDVDAIRTFYLDMDGDGLGDPNHPIQHCARPEGYVDNRDDCDDANPQSVC